MKILFFSSSLVGGAERVACTIAKILVAVGHKVVFCTIGAENQLSAFMPPEADVLWHKREKFTNGMIGTMRGTIADVCPDYVFGTGMPVNWRLVVATLLCKVRPKIILRNENYLYTQSLVQKLRLRFTYPFAKAVIAQTDEMRDGLVKGLGLRENKVVTISNPIDRSFIVEKLKEGSPYPKERQGDPIYVAVGRSHSAKGFDILVKAFSIVKRTLSNAKLYIVGRYNESDEYFQKVRELIDECGQNDSVTLTGFQPNPYVYMRYADCFVLSSRNEGLPNVMLEAMYCGTPVAAFKCIPVIERIVEERKTGYLAEKEDIEGLASAMLRAPKLGRIVSSYSGETEGMILELFE